MTILLASAIFLLAAACQAITGFGGALVAVPLLTLVFGPADAVATGLMLVVLLSVGVAVWERRHIRWRDALLMSVGGAAGAPLGLLVLINASDRALTVMIGVVLLASTAILWFRLVLPGGRTTTLVAGLVSGVLLTSTSFNGPPLAVSLQARQLPRRELRATLALVFVVHGMVGAGLFAVSGELTPQALRIGAVAVPALVVGWWIGDRLSRRMNAVSFRRALLIMLVLCAVAAIAAS